MVWTQDHKRNIICLCVFKAVSHQHFVIYRWSFLCNAVFLLHFVGLLQDAIQALFLTIRLSWPLKSFCGILQADKMVMTYLSVLWTPWPFRMGKNQCHFWLKSIEFTGGNLNMQPNKVTRESWAGKPLTERFQPSQ